MMKKKQKVRVRKPLTESGRGVIKPEKKKKHNTSGIKSSMSETPKTGSGSKKHKKSIIVVLFPTLQVGVVRFYLKSGPLLLPPPPPTPESHFQGIYNTIDGQPPAKKWSRIPLLV